MSLPAYKVNLQNHMAECEANYWRLLKLLPQGEDAACYAVQLPDGKTAHIELKLEQRCRYTSMITLTRQQGGLLGGLHQFEIRAYHDATLAEVTGFQQHRRIRPRYHYPNESMYQQDEKWQQNRFLSEVLIHCLKNGLAIAGNALCES